MNVLVVTTVGQTGLLRPLLEQLTSELNKDVAVIDEWLPSFYKMVFLVLSFHWSRVKWYRRWSQLCEKTPFAFRVRSRLVKNRIKAHKNKYDVVFGIGVLHDISIPDNKPLFLFLDSTRMLSIKNPQDVISKLPDKSSEDKWLTLEKSVYAKAARIFVGSKRVRGSLISDYGIDENKIIVSGFGPGSNHPKPHNKKYDGRSILFVGKGDFEKKGGKLLLEAFKTVKKEIPDATLQIVGQKLKNTDNDVVSHGYVGDRKKLYQLMIEANVFALPSLIDRYAMTIVEAMACQTPCVVSDHGAMPGIVGEGGIIVPKNDVEGLAKALIMLLKDQELSSVMGRAGRARYEENYNWGKIWENIQKELRRFEPTQVVELEFKRNKARASFNHNY